MSKKRWTLFVGLVVISLACVMSVFRLGAANPTSGSMSPSSPPLMWDGTAAGGASVDESTCVEGANCDTFILTVGGTPADWANKRIQLSVTWVVLAHDYDVYVHQCPDGDTSVAGCNAGPVISQSAGGAPSTSELQADINPAVDGTGAFSVHVVYFTAEAADQYHAVATVVSAGPGATPTPPPPPLSTNWKINYHGECCEGNLSAAGDNTFVLLPVLLTGNKIKKSSDGGQTWIEKYPPADLSVPFGIEGDMQAHGTDVIFFGTILGTAVVARSEDFGETWITVDTPITSAGNDQAWAYLGPFPNLAPIGEIQTQPYVLAGWMRIGTVLAFSFDGGLSFPIETPLVGNNGSGPEHVACHNAAVDPVSSPADTRVPNALFAKQKAGRHGAWGTDGKFYWSETLEATLYVCELADLAAPTVWTGTKHPVSPGGGQGFVVTHTAFDNNGTLYVLHGQKLYVSFNQGKSFAFVHTLPRYGSAGRSDSGSDQYFVVDCGTIHVGLLEDAGEGKGRVYYLRGANVDTSTPTWQEELVDEVGNVRLDFLYIVLDGNGVPTISYTTPGLEVTTASRNVPVFGSSVCSFVPVSAVSRKTHEEAPPTTIDMPHKNQARNSSKNVPRKIHGVTPSQTFDVPLPFVGNPGIECRTGGANGDHQVVVTFPPPPPNESLTLTSADVTSGTGEVENTSVNGNEVTVNLTGVANAQVITITLFGVNDGTNTSDVAIPMGVLLADTTADRFVNSADISQTKSQSGQPVTESNFRTDVNIDGGINSADISQVKSQSGTALP